MCQLLLFVEVARELQSIVIRGILQVVVSFSRDELLDSYCALRCEQLFVFATADVDALAHDGEAISLLFI